MIWIITSICIVFSFLFGLFGYYSSVYAGSRKKAGLIYFAAAMGSFITLGVLFNSLSSS